MRNKRGERIISSVAFGEVFLLVFAIVAFGFIVGEVNVVSGEGENGQTTTQNPAKSKNGLFSIIGSLFSGELFAKRGPDGKIETQKVDGVDVPVTSFAGHLLSGLAWGGVAGGIAYFASDFLGASDNLKNALGLSLGIGTAVGRFSYLQFGGPGGVENIIGLPASQGAFVIGAATAALIFVLMYKEEEKKIVQLECLPFEPQLGGLRCEVCNEGDLPCSEYRCKSLGQACDIINVGSSEERCVWINREDVTSPIITPSDQYLTDRHRYTNHQTRPPSLGTRIVNVDNANGCIKPFTPLEFGFTTNEPAQCKIDTINRATLEEMQFFVGGNNLFVENHSERMNLPSPSSIANLSGDDFVIGKDGIYDFHVRCIDANGNQNVDEFVFSFCVDPTPDTTPPIIESTSILSGSAVAFGTDNVNLQVYVNEPAECKWSIQDKAYEDMENVMKCSSQIYEQNARQLYTCDTTLTGIRDRTQNDFYFRCKDQPNKKENERNVNTQSHKFTLLGSQELNIIDFAPNETIFGSTQFVTVELEVETSNGVNEGVSTCSFSQTGAEGSYIKMYETNSHLHRQTLSLTEGDYEAYFRCVDLGGNTDTARTNFSIFIDREAPKITRIYKEGVDALKFITTEEAICSYSLNDCNFAISEGIAMQVDDLNKRLKHYARWESGNVYYVKCQDAYGNQPSPNSCTIAVSASNII